MTEKEYQPKELQVAMEQVGGLLKIRFRPMFGGMTGYAEERPFASLSNRGLALKLAEADRQMLIEAGGRPLQYEQDSFPSKTYTLMPDRLIEDAEALRGWLARSVGHVSTLAASRPRR